MLNGSHHHGGHGSSPSGRPDNGADESTYHGGAEPDIPGNAI